MESNFFIKYRGIKSEDDSEIDLAVLGDSIVGFDSVIKEIFEMSKMKGEISVNATSIRKGCIIVDIVIDVSQSAGQFPFDNPSDFLDFLNVINEEIWFRAKSFLNTLGETRKGLNEFAKEYPADFGLLCGSVPLFIAKVLKKVKNHKTCPNLDDLPKKYALSIHRKIKQGKFKRSVKPFIEDKLSSIEVSNSKEFKNENTKISSSNFENYLSENEKILAEFENGKLYELTGIIVGIQCSRGDSLKLRIHGFPKKHRDLVAYPPEDKTTEDLNIFYRKNVIVVVLFERKSLYQKPKLYIKKIRLQQESLDLFDEN